HDKKHAGGHDDELDDVGHGDAPHAAQQRVKDDDAPADDHGGRQFPAEDGVDDGPHADHLRHRHHDGVDHRHHGAEEAGLLPVLKSQQFADGRHLQPVEGAAEKEAEHHDAEAQHRDEPHAGDSVFVSQPGGADGGGPADDDRHQAAAVDEEPQ